jgi:hypothetical protein
MWRSMAGWVLVATSVLGCDRGGGEASRGDGRDLSGVEITALFADKTVEGHHERKHYDFRSYYSADGELRSYQGPKKTKRLASWRVKGNDICVRWKDQTEDLCRRMVEGPDGSYRKEKVRKNGTRLVVVTFKSFTTGNAAGL